MDCAPSRYSRCVNFALPGSKERESKRPATALREAESLASSSSLSPCLSSLPISSSSSSLSSSSSSFSPSLTKQSTASARPGVVSRSLKPTGTIARASCALEPKNTGQQLTSPAFTRPTSAPAPRSSSLQLSTASARAGGDIYGAKAAAADEVRNRPACKNADARQAREMATEIETEGMPTPVEAATGDTFATNSAEELICPKQPGSIPLPELPQFKAAAETNFGWGNLQGKRFCEVIKAAYLEVTTWKRNIFLVPSGRVGKEFVKELTRLINAYVEASALELVALQAVMTACVLLLQKPHMGSKVKDHEAALERRLRAWHEADIDGLLREGRTIQHHISTSRRTSMYDREKAAASAFARLIMQGKVNSALRYLSDNQDVGLLSLDEQVGGESVRNILRAKHPTPREVQAEALIGPNVLTEPDVHPILFERITGETIRAAALRAKGSAGPSGVDAAGWKRLLCSFHRESKDLCSSVAAFARRLCSTYVDPEGLLAYLACRLVPLSKNPGVRPIGIGEVLRRIIGKAVMRVVSMDVLQAVGPIQLCAGHLAGCEAAVHAMKSIFEEDETEAILLVDAANAFNNLNRSVALRNIHSMCPPLAKILTNCYRNSSMMFVQGETLLSCEGTTQGDPLAMAMFALASVPLIKKIETEGAQQAWFADDASAGGRLKALKLWWDRLLTLGPMYGYFPNALKTSLVVKKEFAEEAAAVFQHTNVEINTIGKRYLGGAIGDDLFVEEFIKAKVAEWVGEVDQLSVFAKSQPHASFAAFTHGLVSQWIYLCRVVEIPEQLLQPLERAIQQRFLPALTGQSPLNNEVRRLVALPPRLGGMGITNPMTMPNEQHRASLEISSPLIEQIRSQKGDALKARGLQFEVKKHCSVQRRTQHEVAAKKVMADLSEEMQRNALVYKEKGSSAWLTALPIERHDFALHKGDFRDALCLRYGWPLRYTPSTCSCGSTFEVDHMLTCKCGGYLTQRHNEIRDLTAKLLSETSSNVVAEPCLQMITGEHLPRTANRDVEARVDIKARGFWSRSSQEAFFDVRVVHPFAPSYRNTPIDTLLRNHENRKKREYGERIRDIERGSFTPLILTTTGGMGREATVFYKRLASLLSEARNEAYSEVMGWIRCRISFALLRSSISCIRGSRRSRTELDIYQIPLARAEASIKF